MATNVRCTLSLRRFTASNISHLEQGKLIQTRFVAQIGAPRPEVRGLRRFQLHRRSLVTAASAYQPLLLASLSPSTSSRPNSYQPLIPRRHCSKHSVQDPDFWPRTPNRTDPKTGDSNTMPAGMSIFSLIWRSPVSITGRFVHFYLLL